MLKIEKQLEYSAKKNLNELLDYLYKFNPKEMELYRKLVNACSTLTPYFKNSTKNYTDFQKGYINSIYALNNAFKHQDESNYKYSVLKIILYGTTLDCILNAPFGNVVYFKNYQNLDFLKIKRQKEDFKKYFYNKRLDIIFKEIKDFM